MLFRSYDKPAPTNISKLSLQIAFFNSVGISFIFVFSCMIHNSIIDATIDYLKSNSTLNSRDFVNRFRYVIDSILHNNPERARSAEKFLERN